MRTPPPARTCATSQARTSRRFTAAAGDVALRASTARITSDRHDPSLGRRLPRRRFERRLAHAICSASGCCASAPAASACSVCAAGSYKASAGASACSACKRRRLYALDLDP